MDDKLAAKRYASALIAVSSQSELEKSVALLENLTTLFHDKKFIEIAKSPLITAGEKSDLIISALSERPTKLVNLIMLLADKNRLAALPEIVKDIRFALSTKKASYTGSVYSSKPLSVEKIDELALVFAKRLGVTVSLKQANESYNGVKVSVEDLGIEMDFSKSRIRSQILGHILRGL
ncbi:ATP synthase subunit delta [Campylobacterota bacterium]|nr:ATP synthase subunit delta [Campylobacterota bacterium]